jgi:hypothetical protein
MNKRRFPAATGESWWTRIAASNQKTPMLI